ncbi:MAG TPA: hypothetical protein VFD13_07365 [Candidatus Kapabacteria bacterium]|nr:hypothetical protein [Candidatus Kapabacteria bacterium]
MKFIRFSIALGVLGLFIASMFNSCRHSAPTGPADTSSCCQGRLTLMVYDSATGHALDGGGASLYDNDHLVSTKPMNDSGTVWDGLCPGHYHITLSKDGYHATEFALDSMGCNDTRAVHHTMVSEGTNSGDSCCGGVAELAVTDSSTHHGVSGASVVLYYNGAPLQSATTSDNGSVRFANLCEGSYRMTIDHDSYHEGVIEFYEHCDATHGFATGLLAVSTNSGCDTASITVRLQDSIHQDSYLSGATVTIRMDGHQDILATGTTTDGGYFTATGLTSPDTYILTFSKDGYNEKSVVMQIGDCRNYSGTYPLSPH